MRYPLARVLILALLIQPTGESRLTGIAEWLQHRKDTLARVMELPRPQAPHRTTYCRILGATRSVEDFECVVGAFFDPERTVGRDGASDDF